MSGASATKDYVPFSPPMKAYFQVPFVFLTLPIKMLIHSKGNLSAAALITEENLL